MISKIVRTVLILLIFKLFACSIDLEIENKQVKDRSLKSQYKEYFKRNTLDDKKQNIKNRKEAPIPNMPTRLNIPKPPNKINQKLISLAITNKIPIKDILLELSRMLGIDVDIDPTIDGEIIIIANNRPLEKILDRISELGNIRYRYEDNTLFFEKDSPYPKYYKLDYLIDSDLWGEVESNIKDIISQIGDGEGSVSSNKIAGMMIIFANSKVHKKAEEYFHATNESASAQVLIEAKIVEVTLTDEYETGINWDWSDYDVGSIKYSGGLDPTNPLIFSLAGGKRILGGGINFSISALEKFGVVRAISSPRVSALNNQKSVLNFSDNQIYFTISTTSSETEFSTGAGVNSSFGVNATKNEIAIGTKLEIVPSINLNSKEITLKINPTISVLGDTVDDPSVNPRTGESLGNKIPIVQTRELETSMKIKSGETLVIGGLMKEDSTDSDNDIPLLSKLPIIKYLFKNKSRKNRVIETVIFIKATIVDNYKGLDRYDRDFYNKFINYRND